MSNQLFQQMMMSQVQNNPTMQMLNTVRSSNNPMQMLSNLAMQNPQMKTMIQQINQSGLTPKQYFIQTAQQSGIDPNIIINQLK